MPAKLIYSAIASLDGYVADKDGGFDWAAPDEEVHAFVNELTRPAGTHLLDGGCTRHCALGHRADRRGSAGQSRLRGDVARD